MTRAQVPEGWDEGVLSLGGHFLQGSGWARVQERLGNQVVVGAHRDWCWLGVVRRSGPFRVLYLPSGPSLRSAAALAPALESARQRARRLGCALVRFEPARAGAADIAALGARQVRSRQHQHTLVLRLDVDEEALRSGLRSGLRRRINTATKRGLRVVRSNDPARIADFIRLLRQTERRAGFFSFQDGYYEAIATELFASGEASLYFTLAENVEAATALVFDFGPTRYYGFAATDEASRQLIPAPPLVWQAILDGRRAGRQRFDFFGAAPPGAGPAHPWSGTTDFKLGFGAEYESGAGTWELTVRPVAARLYSMARAARR